MKQGYEWKGRCSVKKLGCLILVVACLLFGQSSGLAAHWMYVQRLEGTRFGPAHEFVDAESVVKTGTRLTYWTLWVLENPAGPDKILKLLRKNEAELADPQQSRVLGFYQYKADDSEVGSYLQPGMAGSLNVGALRALHYAQDNNPAELNKPEDLQVSLPLWHSSGLNNSSYRLLFDIRNLKATVKGEPAAGVSPEFEITVKQEWTEAGAVQRRAELTQAEPAHHGYRELSYTLSTYRFHPQQRQGILLWQSDHNLHGVTLQYFVGNEWRRITDGSIEQTIEQLGVRWFQGKIEIL
jgi:hypothetical protein